MSSLGAPGICRVLAPRVQYPPYSIARIFSFVCLLVLAQACRGTGSSPEARPKAEAIDNGTSIAKVECSLPDQGRSDDQASQAAIGEAFRLCFQQSGNSDYARQAVDAYLRAARLSQKNSGRLSYSHEISELLVQARDKERLQKIFDSWVKSPDPDTAYVALVDYADGLAKLGDRAAWQHFEKAIEIHPENNIEAINRYARDLIDLGHPQQAVEVIEKNLNRDQRIRFVQPVYLRQEAMRRAGMDTTSADEEVKQLKGKGGVKGPRNL